MLDTVSPAEVQQHTDTSKVQQHEQQQQHLCRSKLAISMLLHCCLVAEWAAAAGMFIPQLQWHTSLSQSLCNNCWWLITTVRLCLHSLSTVVGSLLPAGAAQLCPLFTLQRVLLVATGHCLLLLLLHCTAAAPLY